MGRKLKFAVVVLRQTQAVAQASPPRPSSVEELDAALYSFRDATGLGLDSVCPRFVNHLPREARNEVCWFVDECRTLCG